MNKKLLVFILLLCLLTAFVLWKFVWSPKEVKMTPVDWKELKEINPKVYPEWDDPHAKG